MNLDSYVYFDIECVLKEDAKARLLEIQERSTPERKPSDLIPVHGDQWAEIVLDQWGVPAIEEWVKENNLDEDSLTSLFTAETFRKKPRKGVLSVLSAELAAATGSPVLTKDRQMLVEAAQIVAVAWKDGSKGEVIASDDVERSLKSICGSRRTMCGWNILSYDLPIVQLECANLGIAHPVVDKWGKGVLDLCLRTKFWSGTRRLTDVSAALGYVGDDKLAGGSEVAAAYERGDMDSIISHVTNDIHRLWNIAEHYESIIAD